MALPAIEATLYGAAGALMYEASRWIAFRYDEALPHWMRKPHYYALTAVFIAMGALLSRILGADTEIQAACIGISAPAIVSRIHAVTPTDPQLGSKGEGDFSIRRWMKG